MGTTEDASNGLIELVANIGIHLMRSSRPTVSISLACWPRMVSKEGWTFHNDGQKRRKLPQDAATCTHITVPSQKGGQATVLIRPSSYSSTTMWKKRDSERRMLLYSPIGLDPSREGSIRMPTLAMVLNATDAFTFDIASDLIATYP